MGVNKGMSEENERNTSGTVEPPERDTVRALPGSPPIVSVSDIHGYLEEGRSALLAVGDHPDLEPVVEADDEERLHWAGNDYVLVFNGDLIDRGPHSAETLAMVRRLREEAPPERVRVTVGNHEMGLMLPKVVNWPDWFSGQRTDEERVTFFNQILDGHVVAAYEGYAFTYAHAGLPEPYDVASLNDRLVEATKTLLGTTGTEQDVPAQKDLVNDYPDLFGVAGPSGRGPGAGIFWLDFKHMPPDAPPQIVGHTRHRIPERKGDVVCENVIRDNKETPGGETVFVETPDQLLGITRLEHGGVQPLEFSMPDGYDPEAATTAETGEATAEADPEDSPFEWGGD